MIIILMGVAGSGKTTIGQLLASQLDCAFLEGDSLHPAANIEKMTNDIPLTDADRAPWLAALHTRIVESFQRRERLVVACSALKQQYRDTIERGITVTWVYLKAREELLRTRLELRRHHFMKPEMLASQFADLEEPAGAIVVDVAAAPAAIVRQILIALTADSAPKRSAEDSGRGYQRCPSKRSSKMEEGRVPVRRPGTPNLFSPGIQHQLTAGFARFQQAVSFGSLRQRHGLEGQL